MAMDYRKVKEQINKSKQKEMQEKGREKKKENRVTVSTPAAPEYITLKDGAARYCMSYKTFRLMAYEAHAVYKRKEKCIVNVKIFEEYLETFRV